MEILQRPIHNYREWCSHLVKKSGFGPTGHHHPRSSYLLRVCTVPSTSAVFKSMLGVVFCEGVQHRLRFCLDHLNCVKMAFFQFYFQSGKQRKVWLVGDGSHAVSSQKSPGEKGSVSLCVVVMHQPFLISSDFGGKSLHIFKQSP
jgi:hypothetical protein